MRVEELCPGDFFVYAKECFYRVDFLIEADADDLEALGMILFVDFDEVRKFGDAGSAPRGPEIDDDDLAFEGVA